ncbi:hypothetical protein [Cellulosilyticum ruminicola]|uniref:hypothetical protein n=1 Tax=Cellulosilyticum ruminicola TaxID=425254 RepID=UPI0006D0FB94|nr:hypothetical protein [Cellulosilyticum ruminicola]
MRKSIGKKLKNKGFTYTEFVISLALVTLVIAPICMSFVINRKIYAASNAVEKGVYYTEALMANVKEQLEEEVCLKRQKENIQIEVYPDSKLSRSIQDWLENTENIGNRLRLESFLVHRTMEELEKDYEIQRYAYEVMIWPLKEWKEEKTAVCDKAQLSKGISFYSDINEVFDTVQEQEEKAISKVIEKYEGKRNSKEPTDKQVITLTANDLEQADRFNEVSRLEVVNNFKDGQSKVKPIILRDAKGKIEGLRYIITSSKKENRPGIIEVNVNGLLRKINKAKNQIELNQEIKTFVLQFENETSNEQTIRIIRDALEGVDTLTEIDEKIKVSVLNNENGKINLVRTTSNSRNDDFIIMVTTREKSPIIGKKGKLIKRMIDFYIGE